MEKSKELTVKRKKFVEEYLISSNAAQAYILAGYKAKTNKIASSEGCKLLENPSIKEAIDERMKNFQSAKIASQVEILELLTKGARGELTEEIFLMDGSKKIKQISGKEQIKCMELLGKKHGLFTDNDNDNVSGVKFNITVIKPNRQG